MSAAADDDVTSSCGRDPDERWHLTNDNRKSLWKERRRENEERNEN